VRDLAADEILGPGMASNYPVLIEVFAALCPARLEQATAGSDGTPPPDAVYDTRYACLTGTMEGEPLSSSQRSEACDALAQIENEALELGYCWNQSEGEFPRC
jgi:hypothetical protein